MLAVIRDCLLNKTEVFYARILLCFIAVAAQIFNRHVAQAQQVISKQ